jgi:hypothetical protein
MDTIKVASPGRHKYRYALWPVSVWMSVRQFEKHDADDYVELTSPILATSIAFWGAVLWIAYVWFSNGLLTDFNAVMWMTPIIYLAGLALYINRERHFRP